MTDKMASVRPACLYYSRRAVRIQNGKVTESEQDCMSTLSRYVIEIGIKIIQMFAMVHNLHV